MRELSILGPIWIDALCINQADKQERQSQVGLMSRIYKGAQRIIVWLGKEDKYTAPALEYLRRSKVTPEGLYNDSGFDTKMYHEANFTDEEYDSIFCFLAHRRWFSRLWTIQETVLARDIVFLCGMRKASLETIFAGASALRFRNARAGLNPAYDDISEQAEWAVNLFVVANRRYEWQQEDAKLDSIGTNALSFSNFQATDLRDKVFGLIGISSKTRSHILVLANRTSSSQIVGMTTSTKSWSQTTMQLCRRPSSKPLSLLCLLAMILMRSRVLTPLKRKK